MIQLLNHSTSADIALNNIVLDNIKGDVLILQVDGDDERYTVQYRADGSIYVEGGRVGVMYAIYDIERAYVSGTRLREGIHEPYLKYRGIKINIPLDARTPSYSDAGSSAMIAREYVWDRDYWHDLIDTLSRYKYNVISLWSMMPFPSLTITKGYEDIALDDVYSTVDIPVGVSLSGKGVYTPDTPVRKIKSISIAGKIAFWREVMQYAYDRGVKFVLYTWNTFTECIADSRITDGIDNAYTKEYIYESVKSLIKTYPLLAGIGVTAGENMSSDVLANEQWIYDTYYRAMTDSVPEEREFIFVHRTQMAGINDIKSVFGETDNRFCFGYKYSYAHMYSYTTSSESERFLDTLGDNDRVIMTLRNDDMHFVSSWGDVNYVKAYLSSLGDKCLGFVMGADNFVPMIDRRDNVDIYYHKVHYLRLMLWGECGYDVGMGDEYVPYEIRKYASLDIDNAKRLYEICQELSIVVPIANKVYFLGADYRRYVEFNCSLDESTIRLGVGDRVKYHGILDYAGGKVLGGSDFDKSTYDRIAVADGLYEVAITALKALEDITECRLKEDCIETAKLAIFLANMLRSVEAYCTGSVEIKRLGRELLASYEDLVSYYKEHLGNDVQFPRFCGIKVDFDDLICQAKADIEKAKDMVANSKQTS